MTLTVKIKHNGKLNKAGKLTVIDNSGNTLLSKLPVAIPVSISKLPGNYSQTAKVCKIYFDDNLVNARVGATFEQDDYIEAYNSLSHHGKRETFVVANNVVITSNKSLLNDKNAFVMDKENFDKLSNVLSKVSNFNIEVKRTAFIFFAEDVVKESNENVSSLFNIFRKNESTLKEIIKKRKAEDERERIRNEEEAKKRKAVNKKIEHSNSSNNDPLNDLLAFYNPGLALMFHPHSTLAWFLYFSGSDNALSQNLIDKNIHEISGFENVGSCKFEDTRNGYTVALFSDTNKSEQIGTINVDTQSNCYELTTSSGEKNVVYPTDDGKINLSFVSETGSATKVEMVQNGDNFIGNWSSDNAGAAISAALTIDSQFNFESQVGKTNDLSDFLYQEPADYSSYSQEAQALSESANDFYHQNEASNVSQTLDKQVDFESSPSAIQENTFSTPASDTTSWASSDPYSN